MVKTATVTAILLMLAYVWLSQKIYIAQEIPSYNIAQTYTQTNSTITNVPTSASVKAIVIRTLGNLLKPYNDIILLCLFVSPFILTRTEKYKYLTSIKRNVNFNGGRGYRNKN